MNKFELSKYEVSAEQYGQEVNWEKAKNGDKKEVKKVIDNNIRTIKSSAKNNGYINEDLMQYLLLETIEKAIRLYKPEKAAFNTFLYYVLDSAVKDFYNSESDEIMDNSISLDYEYEDGQTLDFEDDYDLEASYIDQNTIDYLYYHLNEQEARMIDMYYMEELTITEIAEIEGVSFQAIDYRLKKIRKKLKGIIEKNVA